MVSQFESDEKINLQKTQFSIEKGFVKKITILTIITRHTISNYKQTQRIPLCLSSKLQNALIDLDEQF